MIALVFINHFNSVQSQFIVYDRRLQFSIKADIVLFINHFLLHKDYKIELINYCTVDV